MRTLGGILALIGGIAVAAGIAGAVYFFGGFVDVSQTAANPPILDWTLRHVREASIEHRAGAVTIPENVNDPEQIRKGAFEFVEEGCVQCHGAPGRKAERFATGLNPRAPDLTRVRIEPGEAFWAVTNGIKFTAMPAFVRMPEDERWQLTAFVTHMAAVTAEQFSQWSTSPREAAVTRAAQAETQNLPAPSVSTGNTESSEIESPPVGENPPRSNPPPSDESEQNP